MIVSNVQKFSTRSNCSSVNNFGVIKKTMPKDEVCFGSNKLKPKEQGFINDGINDLEDNASKTSKSDLDWTADGLSMQDFLNKENEKFAQQDIDLRRMDIPEINVPDVPDLKLEGSNLPDDIDNISKDLDKSFKSSTFKSILAELGVGIAILGVIYYFLKKHKNNNKS